MKPHATGSTQDWMNTTPSQWLDRYAPGWRQSSYGDLLQTPPADWLRWLQAQYAAPAGTPAYSFYGPPAGMPQHGPMQRHCPRCGRQDCECCRGHCGREQCECLCCIGDVDLVVHARVGEQRVIPVLLENERRRERQITAELSDWRTRGGGAAPVETIAMEPKSFTLAPCGETEIVIAVRVGAPAQAGAGNTPGSSIEGGTAIGRGQRDVDECLVAIADLRLAGCDHRSIRIAVAILPRSCEPLRVPCGCGCC